MKSELDKLQDSVNKMHKDVEELSERYFALSFCYCEALKSLSSILRCYPYIFQECITEEQLEKMTLKKR